MRDYVGKVEGTHILIKIFYRLRENLPRVLGPVGPHREFIDERRG
jgi:hypothetical protein